MKQYRTRLARPSDLKRIARLCKRAVGRNDYALGIVDEIVRARRLFVVFSPDGDLIGMASYTPVFDKSGWLGMARTDPDWRGMGVARFIQRSIATYARKKGIRTLRFFVTSTNSSSLRAARKGGFRVVAHASHLSYDMKKISKFFSTTLSSRAATWTCKYESNADFKLCFQNEQIHQIRVRVCESKQG
jgi:L-amino acid N-acyltransferase YncA